MSTTRTIGLITYQFTSHYHTPLIRMLQARLDERGYRLLCILGSPCEVAAARLAFDRVDGWLVINSVEGLENMRDCGKPLVLVGGVSTSFPYVVPDNHGGTAAALAHLIAEGRTQIAFVMNNENPDFRERYAAYRTTLTDSGIALDPALVLDTQSYLVHDACQAVSRLIASGQHFDAVFCANDWLAFGTMQAIQNAGLRMPEDIAVVGFDDTAEAQFATPPLTSVRQNPTELGRIALDLLLEQIEHGAAPPPCTIVPTALITRRSSTFAQNSISNPQHAESYRSLHWQAQLARDLTQLAIFPLPLAPDTLAEQVWPGVDTLVGSLATVVDGHESQDVPQSVWEHAYNLTGGGEVLIKIIELLRSAGVQRNDGADPHAVERLTRWLMTCQRQAMDQQIAENSNQAERDRQIFFSESMLLSKIGRTEASPRMIDWIAESPADWAILGLWRDGGAGTNGGVLDISSIYTREEGTTTSRLQVAAEHFPPIDLLSAPVRDSLKYVIKLTPLVSANRHWGYLAYAEHPLETFNDMIIQRNSYITAALEREKLLESLRERQVTLQAAYDRERGLADTIRELGCPIIPLLKGVLLVPLIGAIDAARATLIVERVLEEVSRAQAQRVLLDITGVPLVDQPVAAALIQTAQAVGLLGAKVTLVGVRPEIAQSIVGLGVNLGMFETHPVLATVLPSLLRR